jgi:hypothetical protein
VNPRTIQVRGRLTVARMSCNCAAPGVELDTARFACRPNGSPDERDAEQGQAARSVSLTNVT